MQSSASINLIKGRVNIFDEILKWALSVGRLLIILTELVAFTTFIYRFSLDRKLIDLQDQIDEKQAVVASLKDTEASYRNLHERLFVISDVNKNGNKNVKILNDIIERTPEDISFTSFTIDKNQIDIDLNVLSVSSLSNFAALLRAYPETSSVSIDRIDNSSLSNAINVFLTVKLKSSDPETNPEITNE